MRTVRFSPRAAERLADWKATEEEFAAIREHMRALAGDPAKGYLVPFQGSSEKLYRYDVGRFGFIYTYTARRLDVIAVIVA